MKNLGFPVCLVFSLVWSAHLANATDFYAKVIQITDGDIITVLNEANEQVKIRLNGIDRSEKAQAFGNKAKQFTKDLVARILVLGRCCESVGLYIAQGQGACAEWGVREF